MGLRTGAHDGTETNLSSSMRGRTTVDKSPQQNTAFRPPVIASPAKSGPRDPGERDLLRNLQHSLEPS